MELHGTKSNASGQETIHKIFRKNDTFIFWRPDLGSDDRQW